MIIIKKKGIKTMKKELPLNLENLNISEDLVNEIVILYSLGVGIDDLKYFLDMKLRDY